MLEQAGDLSAFRPTGVILHHNQAQVASLISVCRLFDSGVLHYYEYGHLYNRTKKIIARTTTQDRMLKSAEYFLAGFFGLEWPKNATLEVIIEQPGFNNSLAGDLNCKNAGTGVSTGGTNASVVWQNVYLPKAVQRFQRLSTGFTWNVTSVY